MRSWHIGAPVYAIEDPKARVGELRRLHEPPKEGVGLVEHPRRKRVLRTKAESRTQQKR